MDTKIGIRPQKDPQNINQGLDPCFNIILGGCALIVPPGRLVSAGLLKNNVHTQFRIFTVMT